MKSQTQFIAIVIALICSLFSSQATAARYFVEQMVDYNSCTNPDLWDDTWRLVNTLNDHDWKGKKYVDENAWPQDWREACSSAYGAGGLDGDYADSEPLTIFSGHGDDTGHLYFTDKHDNVCTNDLGTNSRLGSMNGAEAGVAMYISCNTLDLGSLETDAHKQWLRQQLGFHDLVGENTKAYASVFNDTCTLKPTSEAWLDRLDHEPSIVVTYSPVDWGEGYCWLMHDTDNLCMEAGLHPSINGPSCGGANPGRWRCWEYN